MSVMGCQVWSQNSMTPFQTLVSQQLAITAICVHRAELFFFFCFGIGQSPLVQIAMVLKPKVYFFSVKPDSFSKGSGMSYTLFPFGSRNVMTMSVTFVVEKLSAHMPPFESVNVLSVRVQQ
jgi:hypothetical protein